MKAVGALPPNPRFAEGYACGAVRWRCRRLALVDSRMVTAVKPILTDAMALVSWSQVRAALIGHLGGIGTHEAVVVAVNQRPNI